MFSADVRAVVFVLETGVTIARSAIPLLYTAVIAQLPLVIAKYSYSEDRSHCFTA